MFWNLSMKHKSNDPISFLILRATCVCNISSWKIINIKLCFLPLFLFVKCEIHLVFFIFLLKKGLHIFNIPSGVQPVARRLHVAQDGYTAQHKIINLLKTWDFSVTTCPDLFNEWPTTTLLPLWPKDVKRLDTPVFVIKI